MNNLAYNSQDPEKVGPKVEEIIRKEVNASAPVPYRVESGNAAPYTVGSAIKEALIGGKTDMLFRLDFDLAEPRPARLEVSIDKMGIGCFAGTLLYSARISRPVAGEVALEPPKTFGKSKFTGEPSTAGRL
ncbi:MAG TPA: hypothetical protein VEZ90_02310, partial [Blastocatellia bacterium]|nr:hypothetical protein [Blastocatellia bacterium]